MALVSNCWCFDIFLIVTVLIILISWYFKSVYSYWKDRGVFYIKPTAPFGNLKDILLFRMSIGEQVQKVYNELGDHNFGGFFGTVIPGIMIKNPDIIKKVLIKDFLYFHDRRVGVNAKKEPLSAHLFALGGEEWKSLRSKLTPTFTSGKLKAMFTILVQCSEEMIKNLDAFAERGESLEIKDRVSQYTMDVIGSCAFGLQLNGIKDPNSEFRKFGLKFASPSILTIIITIITIIIPSLEGVVQKYFPSPSAFFVQTIRETIKFREENNIARKDFLQLLIQLKNKVKIEYDISATEDSHLLHGVKKEINNENEQDIEFTENVIAAQSIVFFLAGFETSSTTASFCLHELAVNPDIQERLRREIDTVYEQHNGELTYEGIQSMKYLEQVIDETLRKYPVAAFLLRECTIPYKISDTSAAIIERGVKVIIPVYALHHDPKHYPNPEVFDPDRFSEENKAKRQQFTYLPFGEGPRICIGMRFGLLQTKVAVTSLIYNYKFSVSQRTSVPLKFSRKGIFVSSENGYWMKIEKRKL